jgi:hypothetical protein
MVSDIKGEMNFELEKLNGILKRASKLLENEDVQNTSCLNEDDNIFDNHIENMTLGDVSRRKTKLMTIKYMEGVVSRI